MRSLIQDLVYAARSFARTPAFTAVVIISVALGVAANSTVYSVVNSLVFASLPVREPDRLLTMNGSKTISWPNFRDIREQTTGKVFEGVSGFFPLVPANVGGSGEPERVWGQLATANFFRVAGVRMALGRDFLPEEDAAEGREPVVVLGYALWQRRFGADASVVGKPVLINGRQYTVVGVAPPGFSGTIKMIAGEFWTPLSMYAHLMPDLVKDGVKEKRNAQWIMVDARLRDGVSREEALAALAVVKNRIDTTYFKNDTGRLKKPWTLSRAGRMPEFGNMIGLMAVLMVVVGLVLLIACANVANLMLARAAARSKEIGIRLSIGASRWRLVRQLLTESVFLALAGAALGFVLAAVAASALSRFRLPVTFPITFDFTPDWRVLLYTIAIALATGVLFGLAPALRSVRTDLISSLKDTGAGFGAGRRFGLRNILVVVQVSLSLILLIGAGLFVRSLANASSIDLGMNTGNVLMLGFDPKLNGYTPERNRQFLSDLRERVEALPGVRAVSFVDSVPLSIGGVDFDFESQSAAGKKSSDADVYRVGRNYFAAFGIPIAAGRDFDQRDTTGTAILNEKLASNLFPGGGAVGSTVRGDNQVYQVIAVVKNAKSRTLGEEPRPCAYLSLEAAPEKVMSFFGTTLVVKSGGRPDERAIRDILLRLDPTLAVTSSETMQQHVDKALLLPKSCAVLLGVFGLIGLTLAAVGLYGVLSYVVRSRTREIGIRMALGADRAGVLAMVVRQGLALAAVGMVVGLALAAAITRFAASFLYGVGAHDVVTFVAVPLVLLAVAAFAIAAPASRAAAIEPLRALRYE
ncbi:MAG: ABC transporter permease [Acidobacteria bacterium]|nr:ABC transporter permease [Acidobacteriota bacterium]